MEPPLTSVAEVWDSLEHIFKEYLGNPEHLHNTELTAAAEYIRHDMRKSCQERYPQGMTRGEAREVYGMIKDLLYNRQIFATDVQPEKRKV